MKPTEILSAAKKEIPYYVSDSYVDNLKSEGDFSSAGAIEALLAGTIDFYAANGNPNKTVPIVTDVEDADFDYDFPGDFLSVVQIRDAAMQTVSYSVDSATEKISIKSGYTSPYELRYRHDIGGLFAYSVDGDGNVTIDTDEDITDIAEVSLIKRLLVGRLKKYNNEILRMSGQIQVELPVAESQGEDAMAEDAIRGNVRTQPSLFDY